MIHLIALLMPGVLLLSPASWSHLGLHCPAVVTFAIYAFRPDGDWKWAVLALAILTDSLLLGLSDSLHQAFRYRALVKFGRKTAASRAGRAAVERVILQNETAIRTLIYHPERPFGPGDFRFRSLSEFLAGRFGPRFRDEFDTPSPFFLRFIGRFASLASTRLAWHSAIVRSLAFLCVVVFLTRSHPVALAACLALLAVSAVLRFGWPGSPLHRSRLLRLAGIQAEVFAAVAQNGIESCAQEGAARTQAAALSRIPLRLTLAHLACLMGVAFALPPIDGQAVDSLSAAVLALAVLHFCIALPLAGWLRRGALIGLASTSDGDPVRATERRTQKWSIAP